MDCKQFRKLISFWVDGILDKQEQEHFIQHMQNCEQCHIELDEYENMISLMKNIEEVQLPEGFHERLHTKLEEEINQSGQLFMKSRKPIKLARWIGTVAAIFVLLFSIKILDDVGFLGMKQAKDHMETKSIEESDAAPELSIASISGDEEDTSVNREKDSKKDSKLEIQFQEKAESNDIKEDDTLDNEILNNDTKYNDISDNNMVDDDTSGNYAAAGDVSENSMENSDIEHDDTSKEDIVDNYTSNNGIADDTLADIEIDENDTRVESESSAADENTYGIMQFAHSNASGIIETDLVKVKVHDVCITPSTIKMMAVNNGIEVIKSTEDSVVLELADLEDRQILYQELSKVGEIEEAGEKTDSMEVTITIVREE